MTIDDLLNCAYYVFSLNAYSINKLLIANFFTANQGLFRKIIWVCYFSFGER